MLVRRDRGGVEKVWWVNGAVGGSVLVWAGRWGDECTREDEAEAEDDAERRESGRRGAVRVWSGREREEEEEKEVEEAEEDEGEEGKAPAKAELGGEC